MSVKKSEQCVVCNENPKFTKHKKLREQCIDCYREGIVARLTTRKMSRVLRTEIGKPVEFNQGEGWRVGYLVKFDKHKADVQPIGAIGRVPDIVRVRLTDIKQATCGSSSMPTIEDFYKKMTVKKPLVLVAMPIQATRVAPVVTGIDLASGPDRSVVRAAPKEPVQAFKKHEQPKKVNSDKLVVGATYGEWTTVEYTGHSRWSCVNAAGEKKVVYAAELKAARGVVVAVASI